MNIRLNKILIVFLLLILSLGIAAAADADGNQSSDELAIASDLPDNLSDTAEVSEELGEPALMEDSLEVSEIEDGDENSLLGAEGDDSLSADGDDSKEDEYDHIVSGTYNGGKTGLGYTVYCADEDLSSPSHDTNLTLSDTSALLNSFYDTDVGELLKIFFYKYYDDIKNDKIELFTAKTSNIEVDTSHDRISELALYFVWAFTDSPYRNINPEGDLIPGSGHTNVFELLWNRYTYPEDIIEKAEKNPDLVNNEYYSYIIDNNIDSRKVVTDFLIDYVTRTVKDYDDGLRVPDIAKKQISDTKFRVYDFKAYVTSEKYQNLFAYKTYTEVMVQAMSVEKISLNKTVRINGQTEFLIVVKNTGNLDLNGIFVRETEYDGLEYLTYRDDSKKWSYEGADTWFYKDTLTPGESVNFTVVFKALREGNLINYVVAGSDDTDDVSSNNNTVVSKPDMKVEKTTATPLVNVGDEVIFTITVTNTGDLDLGDVRVVENPPSGFTFRGISKGDWTGESDTTFTYGGVLKPGESTSFDITYLTGVNGTYTNVVVASSNETIESDTTSRVMGAVRAPRLMATKTAATSDVIAGREIVYVINVTNVGDCDIDDAYVIEEAPESFKYISLSGDGWKTQDGVNFTYSGVLAPGDSAVFEVTYLTSDAGTFENVIYVYSSLTKEKETANDTINVLKPDMEVVKTSDDGFVYLGDETSFTISVTNTGECDLTGVYVEDVLPVGLDFSDYENGTGEWGRQGDRYYLTDSLKVGESATLIIKATANQAGNFTNSASAASDDTSEISSEGRVTVYAPELKVDKVVNDESVVVGEMTSFTITVTNTGDCDLTDVFVEDTIPEGLEYVGYENGAGEWSKVENRYYLTGTLKAGESASLIIEVMTLAEGNFTNTVTAGCNQTDNQTANATVEVKSVSEEQNDMANAEITEEISVSDEASDAAIESSAGTVAKGDNATGNPIMLLICVLSLLGLTGFRKDE